MENGIWKIIKPIMTPIMLNNISVSIIIVLVSDDNWVTRMKNIRKTDKIMALPRKFFVACWSSVSCQLNITVSGCLKSLSFLMISRPDFLALYRFDHWCQLITLFNFSRILP
jgi:hypothetical protein